jgi:hypothetical protein
VPVSWSRVPESLRADHSSPAGMLPDDDPRIVITDSDAPGPLLCAASCILLLASSAESARGRRVIVPGFAREIVLDVGEHQAVLSLLISISGLRRVKVNT